jgi:hypothetical protein
MNAAEAYASGWTSAAETLAIYEETQRRREFAEELADYRDERERKRRARRTGGAVTAGLVVIFLALCLLWGRP